jgi:hypothetical protein
MAGKNVQRWGFKHLTSFSVLDGVLVDKHLKLEGVIA